ncbi:hypothetical protein CQW23_13692 [Capsicum baccatum]|uniref:Uncharacterized protein n=1 Tax=Capsicum baccatum TaxID=33114 RepID=A0A2G2WH25_CAPBA|nr:hypothetical protein CQW23_13692 [Capsicum baccatum]
MEASMEMKKGPWSSDEDSKLIHSISLLGQGRWDSLARFAGRSDNDVKNYWRTKVQKHAKELHCDVNNSHQFRHFLLYQWLPSLLAQQISLTTPPSSEIMTENNSPNNTMTCPNADFISSPQDDNTCYNIWNNLSSFEDEINISHDYSVPTNDEYYCHNYWPTTPSQVLLPDEMLCLDDDMDLWLFP